MFHSRLFGETAKFRSKHFRPQRSAIETIPDISAAFEPFLDGRPDIDRPLTVQFCGNDPEEVLRAAKYVQPYCDAVDLNLGCPQGIARRGRYGAFLQEEVDVVENIIRKLSDELDIPVTAKIRILETKEKTLAYARRVLEAGASILTVHGRQRDQKGHKTGLADWSVITYLRDNLPPETVLFANGNILRHDDIARCFDATGADAIMSAEGNLYDPTIFAEHPPKVIDERMYWQGRDGRGGYRMDHVFREYMSIIYKYVLETPAPSRKPLFINSDQNLGQSTEEDDDVLDGQPLAKRQKQDETSKSKKRENSIEANFSAMQPHLFHLLRPLVSVHTEVRDALARARGGDITAFENVLRLTEQAVKEGLLDYATNPEKYEEKPEVETENGLQKEGDELDVTHYESSLRAVRACKRPWWVCQPYVRPLPKEALEKGSLSLSKKEKKRLAVTRESLPVQPVATRLDRPASDVNDGVDQKEVATLAMVCG